MYVGELYWPVLCTESGFHGTPQLSEELEAVREGLARLSTDPAHTDLLDNLQKKVVGITTKLASPASPARRRRHVSLRTLTLLTLDYLMSAAFFHTHTHTHTHTHFAYIP